MIIFSGFYFQNNILRLIPASELIKKNKSLGTCRVFFYFCMAFPKYIRGRVKGICSSMDRMEVSGTSDKSSILFGCTLKKNNIIPPPQEYRLIPNEAWRAIKGSKRH